VRRTEERVARRVGPVAVELQLARHEAERGRAMLDLAPHRLREVTGRVLEHLVLEEHHRHGLERSRHRVGGRDLADQRRLVLGRVPLDVEHAHVQPLDVKIVKRLLFGVGEHERRAPVIERAMRRRPVGLASSRARHHREQHQPRAQQRDP
jgi:hypothetical protein